MLISLSQPCITNLFNNNNNNIVMGCSRYVNVGPIDLRINVKPLEELDCFKH